jgi:hypothetical protein
MGVKQWRNHLLALRALAEAAGAPKVGREPDKGASTPDVIPMWIGNNRIAVGDKTIVLEFTEGTVLQALIELGAATKPELEKRSRVDDAVAVLKRVKKKYPELSPCISTPGSRGRGGYSTTIGTAD